MKVVGPMKGMVSLQYGEVYVQAFGRRRVPLKEDKDLKH